MPRINPVNSDTANQATTNILSEVKKKMGMVPNLISTMATSPSVANAYLSFSGALGGGSLPASTRERIALTVGQGNECNYCLSAHTMLGKAAGLSESDIADARLGTASGAKEAAAVGFALKLVKNRGNVTDAELNEVKDAGYSDGEIGEIIANVALNIFTNYFNHVADPEIDFPAAPALAVS